MKVTVFTPTYNRDKLIARVFNSLASQTSKDFEWLIIDDGSTDSTETVVSEFRSLADFPIRYEKIENKGKANAINMALTLAKGEFFLVFDSDDWCTTDAIQRFLSTWDELGSQQDEYCSVSCLKAYVSGRIVGEDYFRMAKFGESYIDRFNRRIVGDKWEFLKTSIHRNNIYDLASGERYMAPEYAWLGMGLKYKTVFLNEVLGVVEYQNDGISKNNLSNRIGSPESTLLFYQRALMRAKTLSTRRRVAINTFRFTLHCRRSCTITSVGIVAVIVGSILYIADNIRLWSKNIFSRVAL